MADDVAEDATDAANDAATANDAEQPLADEKILEASRRGLKICIDDEGIERAKMLDDLRFASLDQWPADIRAQRENDVVNGARPCLTIDQINQYITQVSNEMRKNRPSIKTRPVDDVADPETAKIFQGLVRHIEDQSSAQIAYGTAGESATTIGLGFFRITAQYVAPDSFDQELIIKRVPDTFSVYLSQHLMPDGSDADEGWIFEKVQLDKFKRDYPKARISDADFAGLGVVPVWKTEDTVIVCEYFYKKFVKADLLFLADGRSIWKDEYEKLPDDARPEITGTRESHKVTVHWCKHTGCEVLDKREMKGKYIPIVEVVGKEKIVDGKRLLWGLVRPAKDSLRAFNYWISAMTEKMALAPKAPWVGAVGQFATMGDRWDKSNTHNYAKLEYDAIDIQGNAVPAPRRQEPVQFEAAMAQMLGIMQNNVKSSLGMYKAALGDTESQQSGRAILALQRESDTGTMHFGENQALSVIQGGRILVDLIPHYYDTARVLRIIGEDGAVENAEIDPEQKESVREVRDAVGKVRKIYNLGVGKFDVTVTVGPGYTTSRQEAATVMTELANTAKDPATAAIFGYGAVKNSDFAGSEEISKMLKAMLPPQILQAAGGDGQAIPPAALQKMAAMQQQGQALQDAFAKTQQENVQLKAGVQEGLAKVAADQEVQMAQLALDEKVEQEKARLAREKFEFERALAIDQANHEADLAERKAAAENKLREDKLRFERECAEREAEAQPARAQ